MNTQPAKVDRNVRTTRLWSWLGVGLAATLSCELSYVVTTSTAFAAAPAPDRTLFRFLAKAGPHAVGLRVVDQYDYSRVFRRATDEMGKPYQGERARPVQTLIWYPAKRSDARPMTVADYGALSAREISFEKPKMTAHAKESLAAMRATLETPLWAVRNAAAASGRYPVVIYAPGWSSESWENADLCEYLASYGYLVIASPDVGVATREDSLDLNGANNQARDIAFLVGYARALPNADTSTVAVIGFSWGGISNLFAAARDGRIGILVALDGEMRYSPGLVRSAGDVHPENMTIPLLAFVQHDFPFEAIQGTAPKTVWDGPNVLNAWTHGDLVTVHMLGLFHAMFSSMKQRNDDVWWAAEHLYPMMLADYSREDEMMAYTWMARYVLSFLDAYIKQDATAMAFMKRTPAENGVPKHVMATSFRAAAGVPASFDGFRAEVGRRGFSHVADIYAALQVQRPDFTLDVGDVNFWAEQLMDDKRPAEAIALLKWSIQVHADSSASWTALGVAHRMMGESALAEAAFAKSVELDPGNFVARRQLVELRKQW